MGKFASPMMPFPPSLKPCEPSTLYGSHPKITGELEYLFESKINMALPTWISLRQQIGVLPMASV